jgi:GNAT superfamily N-acetyltransferase
VSTQSPAPAALALRPGSAADVDIVVGLLDRAVEWLVAQGRTGQWGDQTWSSQPHRVERIGGMLRDNELTVAWSGDEPVGVIVVGDQHAPYVDPPPARERYIHLLVTSPAVRGQGVGTTLLDHVREQTRRAGIPLLRVDSWGGGDRKLVAYYVSQGFTPVATFNRDGWEGQVYEQWLGERPDQSGGTSRN